MLRCATKTVFWHMVFLARIYRVGIHRVYSNKTFFLKKWLSTWHPVTHLAKSLLECTSKFKMFFFSLNITSHFHFWPHCLTLNIKVEVVPVRKLILPFFCLWKITLSLKDVPLCYKASNHLMACLCHIKWHEAYKHYNVLNVFTHFHGIKSK